MSENFKSVLEIRRENMKKQKLRKDQFSSTNLSAALPANATQGKMYFNLAINYSSINKSLLIIENMKMCHYFFLISILLIPFGFFFFFFNAPMLMITD